jgi:hypothetical protein
MPLMGWKAFEDSHYRPFRIFGDFSFDPQGQFTLVGQLLQSMVFRGNYSLVQGKRDVQVAFELEADAYILVRAVGAKPVVRKRQDCAGHWAFNCPKISDLPESVVKKTLERGAGNAHRKPDCFQSSGQQPQRDRPST